MCHQITEKNSNTWGAEGSVCVCAVKGWENKRVTRTRVFSLESTRERPLLNVSFKLIDLIRLIGLKDATSTHFGRKNAVKIIHMHENASVADLSPDMQHVCLKLNLVLLSKSEWCSAYSNCQDTRTWRLMFLCANNDVTLKMSPETTLCFVLCLKTHILLSLTQNVVLLYWNCIETCDLYRIIWPWYHGSLSSIDRQKKTKWNRDYKVLN